MGEDAQAYPNLVEFLTLSKFEDGSSRVPGSLIVFVEEGRLKAMLNDREESRVAFRVYDSLELLLGGVEADLREGLVDWRRSKDQGGRRGKA